MIFPEQFRIQPGEPYNSPPGAGFGYFLVPPQKLSKTSTSRTLKVIAADGWAENSAGVLANTGWAHASVTLLRGLQCPTWDEMCLVRKLFWEPGACVIQYHPPASENISLHPGCLHLWQSTHHPIPMPPSIMV